MPDKVTCEQARKVCRNGRLAIRKMETRLVCRCFLEARVCVVWGNLIRDVFSTPETTRAIS